MPATVAVILSLFSGVRAESARIAVSGGESSIELIRQEQINYLSLTELTRQLGGLVDWEIIGHRVRWVIDSQRFEFVIGSPFIKQQDRLYNLTYPAVYQDGNLFLPALTFVPFLDDALPQQYTWSDQERLLRVESEYFNVTDLAFSPKANGLLIEIFLSKSMAYDAFVTEGNWLNISIRDGRLNTRRLLSRRDRRLVYDLKVHQAAGAAQVSIQLRQPIEKWHHKLVADPPRIQISIPDVTFQMDTLEARSQPGASDKIDVIVIDAGHGGSDYGAIGPRGAREKDVVLDITRKLAKLIRSDRQFKVVMTRDRDQTVTLDQRSDIANKAGADLFVSVHANSSVKKQVRGWNVFFLAPAKNDSARAVAQFENSFFLRERSAFEAHQGETEETRDDPVLTILNEMMMTEFQTESHDFAMMVDREFRRGLNIPARGVDQAGFFVLNKVFTPSVLVETGFMSNQNEEKLLTSGKYQDAVAKAIYNAIKKFKSKYEIQ
ncbi:MAG TPA: N-acetylmuramoyl-L-alanine amidase [Candidatus Deferrimicrobium sp.]|nr:N-acetylmuramoyl-L-alanine amidase [Candidatus Deferrimicrobium sp.]